MTDNSDLLQRLRGWLYERTDVAPEGYAFDKHTITFSLDRIPDYQNNPRWTETPLYGQDVIESQDKTIAELREQVELQRRTVRSGLDEAGRIILARAEKAEANNAALRAENARLLQLVLAPGTIPFNCKE